MSSLLEKLDEINLSSFKKKYHMFHKNHIFGILSSLFCLLAFWLF